MNLSSLNCFMGNKEYTFNDLGFAWGISSIV